VGYGIITTVQDDRPQVTQLAAPRWGGGMSETITPAPSRLQVEQALRDLDGGRLNDLYLRTSDDLTYLGICGGAGRYQVTIADHHERFAQLVNTRDPSAVKESIRCGGQLTPFPRRHLVDFDTALSAAVHYLHAGEADPTLIWEWYR
jgi:hypothetical protein